MTLLWLSPENTLLVSASFSGILHGQVLFVLSAFWSSLMLGWSSHKAFADQISDQMCKDHQPTQWSLCEENFSTSKLFLIQRLYTRCVLFLSLFSSLLELARMRSSHDIKVAYSMT
jgi:hypothetical protein